MSLDLDSIHAAHERIRAYIHRTPVLTSSRLDGASGASLFFKCENFQTIGAFKARGATNAVFSLDDATARRGVATHSSGNHGAAVARAAKLRGISAHIVMPSTYRWTIAKFGSPIFVRSPSAIVNFFSVTNRRPA